MTTVHDFTLRTIDGAEQPLRAYAGKTLLIVNVASECGLTPQYEELQRLYEEKRPRGLEVLGFPCNQFGGQEPGDEDEIKEFCSQRYGVTFPLFAKIEVNGAGRSPLYEFLTGEETDPDGSGDIVWNFAKFVVDGKGQVIARFPPTEDPRSPKLLAAIDRALAG
jgi:glutathione peroxidase